MSIGLELSVMQNLLALLGVLIVFAVIGLKRGWKGQLITSGLMVLLWAGFDVGGDVLIRLSNNTYRSVLFFALCGTQEDPSACPRSPEIAQAVLVDPNNWDQKHLFFLIALAFISLLAYVLVLRFTKAPPSILHKLAGVITGVVNGFLVGYLLLPLALQRGQLLTASAQAIAEESSPQVAQLVPEITTTFQTRASLIFLVLFVLYVVIAVRLIRRTKPQSDGHSEA